MSHRHNENHYLDCEPCRDKRESWADDIIFRAFGTSPRPLTTIERDELRPVSYD